MINNFCPYISNFKDKAPQTLFNYQNKIPSIALVIFATLFCYALYYWNKQKQLILLKDQARKHSETNNPSFSKFSEIIKKINFAAGKHFLGICYNKCQDLAKIFQVFQDSVKAAFFTDAQNRLGFYYFFGYSVTQNHIKAFQWFKKAADGGHSVSQFNLAWCYANGLGVIEDKTKAFQLFKKAADAGVVKAQVYLGFYYYSGTGVSLDFTKAFQWFKKAADAGNSIAEYNLASCYYIGNCVTQDITKAVQLFHKSAEAGDVKSQLHIGDMYFHGNDIEKDLKEAYKWFSLAAGQGNAEAQGKLDNHFD